MVQIDLPEEIQEAMGREATAAGVSLKDLLIRYLRERIEYERQRREMFDRSGRGGREAFQAVLASVPDAPPVPGDELPEGWKGQ